MFSLKVSLDLGDLGKREADVLASATDSFGTVSIRVISVQIRLPIAKHRNGLKASLELRDLLSRAALVDIDEAIRERYQQIQDRHSGFPQDWPRDTMEGA